MRSDGARAGSGPLIHFLTTVKTFGADIAAVKGCTMRVGSVGAAGRFWLRFENNSS